MDRQERKALWLAKATAHFDTPEIRQEASEVFEKANPIENTMEELIKKADKEEKHPLDCSCFYCTQSRKNTRDQSPQEKKCICACHDNKLQKDYDHTSKCCENMNGYVEEKCECGDLTYTCPLHYPSIPTWEKQFDKTFTKHNLRDDLSEQKVGSYIKEFIRVLLLAVREEERIKVMLSIDVEMAKAMARDAALEEVREMLKDVEHDISRISQVQNWQDGVEAMMHQIGRHMQGGYNAEYEALGTVRAYSRILSSIQQLKDRK